MTEELEKEAEEYADTKVKDRKGYNARWELVRNAYLAGAEPRQKRIVELEKENAELKEKWLQATDEGTSWAHRKILEQENAKAKELLKNIIRVTWGEGWNYSLDWKVKAEQFLSEVEK